MYNKSKLRQPNPEKLTHSEQLLQKVKALIATQGSIPFSEYMQLALYDSQLGYYKSGLATFGRDGDFITAPELSPLFSYCVGAQFVTIKAQLTTAAILEFGAGSGRLAADCLHYLAKHNKLPDQYFILETSPTLQQRQQELLAHEHPDFIDRIVWLDQLPADNSFNGLIVANEVLDAMPVELFRLQDNTTLQGYVGCTNEQLELQWQPATTNLQAAISRLDIQASAYESEINLWLYDWVHALAKCINQGGVLLIDYGYERSSYYHPQRNTGTLMCHLEHQAHSNPLIYPGIQDITAHVDFTAIAEAASDAGMDVINYMTQAYFLMENGISNMLDPSDTANYLRQSQQLKQLMMPAEMGEKFKTILLGKNLDIESLQAASPQNALFRL